MGMDDYERAYITAVGAEDAYGKNAVDRYLLLEISTILWHVMY